ncbi:ATPase family AAA domain-containing protein 5-like isoform X2 [Dysidea avara]|uniref:ATPase family AAA domain-containing protein 5-like isoform X2 n=1 Tax=Dysidea avara TaxID=196820 RepID=UPI003332323F
MSLITAYFKADNTAVANPPPSVTCNDNSRIESAESSDCVVDPQVLDEDSNSKDAAPPKKMKIALFTVHEPTPNLSVNCVQDHIEKQNQMVERQGHSIEKQAQPVEKQNELVEIQDDPVECQRQPIEGLVQTNVTKEPEKLVKDTNKDKKPEETAASVANEVSLKENHKKSESTAQAKKQQQTRQTTLNFQNGKCILVPMELEPDTGMETGSQESSQLESTAEDDYPPKKQQRKRRKKKERANNEDGDTASQDENITVAKKSCRKAAREATERLNELLKKTSCEESTAEMETAILEESVETKVVPQIIIEDNQVTCNVPSATDTSDVVVISPSIAKDEAAADSSDSDVICLTPRSASPLSQELQSSPSKPSTPAKNKWAHIFGPHKKPSSPGRKSSPRKGSPKNSPRKTASPRKQTIVMSSAVSHEQLSLGVTLFHHVMQQDSSLLWDLPKIELPAVNIKSSPLCHPHRGDTQHVDHVSKELMAVDNCLKAPFHLKFATSDEKRVLLKQFTDKNLKSLYDHYTSLNKQLSAERARLLAKWAEWEKQYQLVQQENERLLKEVVEVPEDPSLELIVSIRFLRTDISSESVTVDAKWYRKQQASPPPTTYNFRRRSQQQSWKEPLNDSDASSSDYESKCKHRRQRRVKKRRKKTNCIASDDEDSSWNDNDQCEKKKSSTAINLPPQKQSPQVVTKPLPGLPIFKPLNDLWVDLYSPTNLDDILGNQQALQILFQWLIGWKDGHSGINGNNSQKKSGESDCMVIDSDSNDCEEEGASKVLLVRGKVGCGKTSAIYACANKLGYKVFEVNSSSRRSGSQVISILQEATQSRQIVTQRATKQSTLSQGEGDDKAPDKTCIEKSSRTITSFFKPMKGPAAKEGGGAQSKDTAGAELSQQSEHLQVTLASHSVILVEEVDILFEDDKGFWSAMYDIINMSKRPIILTCNDPHLQLECHHNVIDMCRPSEQELVDHLQVIALSHDFLLPAGMASTLSALLQCDVRQVIHTLHFSLCHANTSEQDSIQDVPSAWSASLLEQEIIEAKSLLYPNLFLSSLVEQLNASPVTGKIATPNLQRPWRCHDSKFKNLSQTKQCKYFNCDIMSDACDWLSHCDIIRENNEQSPVLDPNGAHSWWEVREQSCFLATSQESLNQLEVEKLDKHKEEMASFMDNMTGQHFGIKDHSDMLREEMVVTMAKKCRWCGVFNQRTSNIVQDDLAHCQLLHSAIATDYLPLMNLMCKYEEDRKARQRRFRHYLSARGIQETTISSLLHHYDQLTCSQSNHTSNI